MPRLIIDVRTPAEYALRHLEDAINVSFDAPDFGPTIAEYPRDWEYAVYCNAGNRAGRARARMLTLGFRDVTSYGIMGAATATGQRVVYQSGTLR
ncbi:MAG: rhodanese-like domain-containing protein [Propionibacteriaceae bacterium]|jgi:phage shock protein E|nr:rhodanese-like domain-containing protein [Propionibacteriaceae bacterium]